MTKLNRANLVLGFVASVFTGVVSCMPNSASSSAKPGGAGGSASGGSSGGGSGGSSTGGTSGGSGGSPTGGSSGGSGGSSVGGSAGGSGGSSAGGKSGGSGGSSAGGSGGSSTGGRSGGTGGSSTGGSLGGPGGSSVGGNSGGAGGGAGGGQDDAGPDSAKADVAGADRRASADLAGRDTAVAADLLPTDDAGACPGGLTVCGTSCVDTTTTTNCGACGRTCGTGQTCNAGVCVEGGSAGSADGCTSNLASNLTLQQIAVYQSVKIPVMQDGAEVAAASRNAAVVQGRDTMVRAFVTLGSGWTARELSARLTWTPTGGQAAQYYSKKTISASSVDSDLTTSFQIFVPASAMAASLTYSVEVVECTSQSGTAGAARFPTSGDLDLGVKTTGGFKIKVIPLQVDTFLPDTSATGLAGYLDYMRAMYPINDISISVGDTLTTTSPVDWSGMLDQVRAKRATDKPTADVYYFGLVKPADTLRTYCQSSCTTGIGYVVSSATGTQAGASRAAVGIGFADSASHETMAHEIGHNLGREHAPCGVSGTTDPNYPYAGGLIGSWGYDARTQKLFDPTKISDIMGYCNNKWISDYTYSAFTTRVAAVNGVAMVYTPDYALSRWRILLIDDRGPRWGIPITDEVPAEGDVESAIIYDSAGVALTSIAVYRTKIADIDGSMLMVPEPQPGWYAVAVAGAPPLPFAP